jgi:long-chain acyl-CoA synthetase
LHFKNRVVSVLNNRPKSVWQFFLNNTIKYPNNIAVVDNNKKITYKELYNFVHNKSKYLIELGLKKGDRACVLFENSWPLIICFLAGLKEGVIIVPLNPKSTLIENERIINNCSAKAVFFDKNLEVNLPSFKSLKSIQYFKYFNENKYINVIDVPIHKKCSVKEEEIAFILYTSGTTGLPKGAMITNFNIIHSCFHFQNTLKLSEKDKSILAVPATHITGLVAHVMTMLYVGGSLILMKSFKVKEFLTLAEKEKLSYLIMVPAMYNLCLHREDLRKYNLLNWRIGGFGGAPMPVGTIKKLKQTIPSLLLINAYGSTETCSPATIMPLKYKKNLIASVGRVVEAGKILIMNEKGYEVATGQPGELWISGPMVIPGYWNDASRTKKEFVSGFWKSGDIGYVDNEGYIFILDRKKDVINRGGYKIYSSEIENLLSLSDLVIETAVLPCEDSILGEKIHVVIYTKEDSKIIDQLKSICTKTLAEYKQPDYWTFLNKELPKNKNGKVIKAQLIKEMSNKFKL